MASLQQTLFPAENPAEDAIALEKAAPTVSAVSGLPATREAFLRERLLAKQQAALGQHLVTRGSGAWDCSEPGLRTLSLHGGPTHRTLRIDMAAGSEFSRPREETQHECWVLKGEVRVGHTVLREGDFLAAPQVEPALRWSSPCGAQLLLVAWLKQ